jgi:hypothetical protein
LEYVSVLGRKICNKALVGKEKIANNLRAVHYISI